MALRQREVFAKRLPLYRKDPCLFFKEVTRFKPDKWQKEAAKLEFALSQIPEKNLEERQVLVDKIQAIKEVLPC